MTGEDPRRSEALIEAGLVLASELSLPAVLQKIIELACDVADARYGALGIVAPNAELQDFITHGITEAEYNAIGELPHGRGVLGVLIHDARPLRLPVIQDDPRSYGFPPNHPPMTTFLGVPIKVAGRVFGNLYLTEKRGADEFSADDERAVITLATQAAIAIDNARLYAEVERLAVVEDRERIARELHDGIVQSLFAVGLSLQAAEASTTDDAVRSRLEQATDDIDRAIRDLRSYIFGLRPGASADLGLTRALGELVEEFRRGTDVLIDLEVEDAAGSALAGRAQGLVQIAREALSNAIRHADPSAVRVAVRTIEGAAELVIIDDGAGFIPDEVHGGGHGLGNLRARAEAAGGTLIIETSPGAGTSVRVSMPL